MGETENVTSEASVSETVTPEAPPVEQPIGEDEPTKRNPVSASWAGIEVVFRGQSANVVPPTRAQLEDALRSGLAAAFGESFDISVSGAERTDR